MINLLKINSFITVYDSDSRVIARSCGTTPPSLIISSSNSLKIVFQSDFARNARGFKASWTTKNIDSVNSQYYPLPYHNDVNEVIWTLCITKNTIYFDENTLL